MNLEELRHECENCQKCGLGATRTNLVFGVGNENADLMFVGEAPGEKEDLSGEPFVGAAGKLFNKYLEAVDIKREEVYIANILKCRPPKNRDPQPAEEDACIDWLREQVKIGPPEDDRMSRADLRDAAHQAGLQNNKGARSVVRARRI